MNNEYEYIVNIEKKERLIKNNNILIKKLNKPNIINEKMGILHFLLKNKIIRKIFYPILKKFLKPHILYFNHKKNSIVSLIFTISFLTLICFTEYYYFILLAPVFYFLIWSLFYLSSTFINVRLMLKRNKIMLKKQYNYKKYFKNNINKTYNDNEFFEKINILDDAININKANGLNKDIFVFEAIDYIYENDVIYTINYLEQNIIFNANIDKDAMMLLDDRIKYIKINNKLEESNIKVETEQQIENENYVTL